MLLMPPDDIELISTGCKELSAVSGELVYVMWKRGGNKADALKDAIYSKIEALEGHCSEKSWAGFEI
jgi:hypothetical protein